MTERPQLTSKGERTRERILETALRLFVTRGYEQTTLRAIAAEAGCSLGLTYRYFASKEQLVLTLYDRLADDLAAQVRLFPPAPLADRFDRAMRAKLAQLAPYRDALAALVGATLNPRSEIATLGANTAGVREAVGGTFALVVSGATDAPPEPQAGEVARVLYGLHLALIFLWLQDGSPDARATDELLAFTRDALALMGPLLGLEPVAETLHRLARIVDSFIARPTS